MAKTWLSRFWRFGLVNFLTIGGAIAASGEYSVAQIQPDSTLGDESSVVNSVDANSDRINGGAIRGSNLLHSFSEFNVGEGRSVYFANPGGIENIFNRVTGSNPSNILGKLGVLGNANLFLLNPNGIIFGENASLDVQGSFTATTAESILFENGQEFSAIDPQKPILDIKVPLGLQMGSNPGNIISRSIAPDPVTNIPLGLQIQPGKSISLIGGEVSLDGGVIFAPGGRVDLGGLNTAGTIEINNDGSLNFPENVERDNVFLSNDSVVAVFSGGGGFIAINSKNLELTEGSFLQAGIASGLGSPETQAGDIAIDATDRVSLDGVSANGASSGIYNFVLDRGVGNTGKIQITTSDLSMTNGGTILSALSGTGNLGNVTINANNNISLDGLGITGNSNITNQIAATGSGSTGNINISAKNFSLTNGSSISNFNGGKGNSGNINIDASDTIFVDGSLEPFVSTIFNSVLETGVGNAGAINLNSNNLVLTNGGNITSLTSGEGNSGNITINARNNISLDGEKQFNNDPLRSSIITSVPGVGNSGNIDISTHNLSLTNGASIAATAIGKGNAGDINIAATDSVSVNGKGSKEGTFSSINGGLTQGATGNGGNIKVVTSNLRLSNDGGIFGVSTGKGNGANLTIEAKEEVFLDRGTISSSIPKLSTSVEEKDFSEGNGGDINITAKKVLLVNNSSLTSGSSGKGDGGDIQIDAREKVFLDGSLISNSALGGSFFDPNSRINVNFFGEGNSGNIEIKSGQILLDNNARIGTANAGIGNAGNISIEASDIFSAANGSIINSNIGQDNGTKASGKVGNIAISAQNVSFTNGAALSAGFRPNTTGESGTVFIKATDNISFDSSIISTGVESGAIANGSDINLEANSIFIINNSQLITSTLGVGKAGNVTINANDRTSLDGSFIFSTTEAGAEGNGGQIKVDTGTLNLAKGSQILTSVRQAQNNLPGGTGNAGNVIVNARGDVKLDGILNVEQTSGIGSELETGAVGKAGNLEISSNSLSLTNNAVLSSQTLGIGDAGNITINALDRVSSDRSRIFSQVRDTGRGRGGDIAIATQNFFLTNGAQLVSGVFGVGEAGNITINVSDTISFDGQGSDDFSSGIFSSIEEGGKGSAGSININTKNLSLTNGGQVTAVTFGDGNAGDFNINASDLIFIDGSNEFSGVFTSVQKEGKGNGGSISLNTNNLALINEAEISTQSFGLGNAGNIKINVESINLDNNSSIAASNTPSADISTTLSGGNIDLLLSDNIILRNSDISTQASSNANGGDINITADAVIAFDDSDIFSYAQSGTGGNITLDTPAYFGSSFNEKSSQIKPDSANNFFNNNDRADINATGAVSGVVTVPDVSFIQNSLADLPDNAINTENLIANSCVVRDRKQEGKFIITGKGGLPENPADASVSSYPTGDVRGIEMRSNNSNRSNDAIVEPQGLYRLTNGQLVLSRECTK